MSRQEEDFTNSGLSFKDLSKAQLVSTITEKELLKLFPQRQLKGASGTVFHYYDLSPDGTTSKNDYCRYKVYWPPLTGFAAQAKDDRPKYLQVAGSPNHLYTPPFTDWKAFLQGNESLIVTEGEKKTLAAQVRGLACVGLGGVDSFSNSKRGIMNLPGLSTLVKNKRRVYIVYDVDVGHTTLKPEVARAAIRLATHIADLGGVPSIVTLPSSGNEKMALDDWLMKDLRAGIFDLWRMLQECAAPIATAELLYQEAEKYVYIDNTNYMGRVDNREGVLVADYKIARSQQQVPVWNLEVDKKSGMLASRIAVKTLGDAFITWRSRPTARGTTYAPGDLRVVTEDGYFNQWLGWAQPVKEGVTEKDIQPLMSAFKALYEDDWKTMWGWFMYPLARPGEKQDILPIIQSEVEGLGKSSIPAFFATFVYGEGVNTPNNAATLNSMAVGDKRLDYIARRQFVFLDDVNDIHSGEAEALLKYLVTTPSVSVDPKYLRRYSCKNFVNVCMTTNRSMVFRLKAFDRRMFFPKVSHKVPPTVWRDLHAWGKSGGGGITIGYAQQVFDVAAWEPKQRAPMTDKKKGIIQLAQTPVEEFMEHLCAEAREGKLARVVTTVTELKRLMITEGVEENLKVLNGMNWAIKNALMQAEGIAYKEGAAVWVNNKTEVVYILDGDKKWLGVPQVAIAKEISSKSLRKGGKLELIKPKKY